MNPSFSGLTDMEIGDKVIGDLCLECLGIAFKPIGADWHRVGLRALTDMHGLTNNADTIRHPSIKTISASIKGSQDVAAAITMKTAFDFDLHFVFFCVNFAQICATVF